MFVVAGVTGRTGRVVAESLLSASKPVRALVRDAADGEPWRQRGAEVAVASLADAAALGEALRGATGFYVLVPEDATAADFYGHRRAIADAVATAVTEARVAHVVLLSAPVAALAEGNGPGKDLYYAEALLRATPAIVTALRASYFQENVLSALAPARSEGVYPNFLPSADLVLPTVATCDVGQLAARCLLEPPPTSEIIDLVGPAYSPRQLADALGAVLNAPLRVVDVPAGGQVEALVGAGLPPQYASAIAELLACYASGRVSLSGDRTVQATTSLHDTLSALIEVASR